MDNINGITMVWDTQDDNALLGSLFPQVSQSQNFESLTRSGGPYESSFEEDSVFYTPQCAELDDDFYKEPINCKKLASNLASPKFYDTLFIAENFLTPFAATVDTIKSFIPDDLLGTPLSVMEYTNTKGKRSYGQYNVNLNKSDCYLSRTLNLGIHITNNLAQYELTWFYIGATINNSGNGNDYDVEPKFKAVKIIAYDYEDCIGFINVASSTFIDYKRFIGPFKERITKEFLLAFKKAGGDAKTLKSLYEQAPDL